MSQNYSGNAVADVLDASMTNSQDTATIADGTGWPTADFVATIHRGEVNEEQIYVTTRSGTALSGITRGYAGSTAYAHDANEAIEHTADAVSMQRWEDHIADTIDAHDATAISFSPTGTIAATTVQAAVAEVSGDVTTLDAATTSALAGKAATSHSHVTGDITSLAEFIRDTIATALTQGTGITVTVDDPGDTITVAATTDTSLPQGILDQNTINFSEALASSGTDDVTGLSVAFTLTSTRKVRVSGYCAGVTNGDMQIRNDSNVVLGLLYAGTYATSGAAGTVEYFAELAAGSYSFKLSSERSGAGTWQANEAVSFIIAEDLGPG